MPWSVDVEQSQGNLNLGLPCLLSGVGFSLGDQAISNGILNEKVVERVVLGPCFGRIVYEGLVCDVVRIDFKFQVRLRIVFADRDEGFHHFVFPNVIICAVVGVEVEVFLVLRFEGKLDGVATVTKIDVCTRERLSIRNRFAEIDGGFARAPRNCKTGWVRAVSCCSRRQ